MISAKETMDLKENWEGYVAGSGGRKGKGEVLSLHYHLKNCKKKKFLS